MTDAVDEARAELIGWFVRCCEEQVCDHHTYRDCEAEMRAAADRYALAVQERAIASLYAVVRLGPTEDNWFKACHILRADLLARLEGGSHED